MPKLLIATLLLVLCGAGCRPMVMTNDEIISETKKCHEAGMGVETYQNSFSAGTTKIVCCPKINADDCL
jgi:uncharacterized cupredoxin-like copper-binding protein